MGVAHPLPLMGALKSPREETDYQRIAAAIAFIVDHVGEQPALGEVAAHVGLSPSHFQRLFSRWAGVTPKRFLQTLTVERGKSLLRSSTPVLEASYALGLSSGARLYDHFVQVEAVTPGEVKSGGAGLVIRYAVHSTPFGAAFIATTSRGICDFLFLDGTVSRNAALTAAGQAAAVETEFTRLQAAWPAAQIVEDFALTRPLVERMFQRQMSERHPLSLHVSGTNFQVSVWRALLAVPPAQVTTYGHIARAVGRPHASRAVGQAVGANPVSFLVPCHRVIQSSGKLGGYRWGTVRKQAMLAWEAAHQDAQTCGTVDV